MMQLDMHYYGTYAMARASGLRPETCQIVAAAAQFVDDNAGKEKVEFDDGARIDVDATAHHTVDVHNTDPKDQRKVFMSRGGPALRSIQPKTSMQPWTV